MYSQFIMHGQKNIKLRTVLVHPPHSPGLAPSDFYLIGALRFSIHGKRFGSDEEITEEVPESTKFKLIKELPRCSSSSLA